MSDRLTIIATIEAKKEKIEQVKEEVLKLLEPTRQEKGCLQYDLYQENEKPEIFIFVENWENKKLWQMHMESAHLKAFLKNTDGLLANLVINQMHKVI